MPLHCERSALPITGTMILSIETCALPSAIVMPPIECRALCYVMLNSHLDLATTTLAVTFHAHLLRLSRRALSCHCRLARTRKMQFCSSGMACWFRHLNPVPSPSLNRWERFNAHCNTLRAYLSLAVLASPTPASAVWSACCTYFCSKACLGTAALEQDSLLLCFSSSFFFLYRFCRCRSRSCFSTFNTAALPIFNTAITSTTTSHKRNNSKHNYAAINLPATATGNKTTARAKSTSRATKPVNRRCRCCCRCC